MARSRLKESAELVRSAPYDSDVDQFCYRQGVVDLDTKISDGTLDPGVPGGNPCLMYSFQFPGLTKA